MLNEYIGVSHIHTTASDGSGSFEEVVKSAKKAGLDFITITDHDTLKLKNREGYYGNTLVLVGEEISPDKSHYLALNIKKEIDFNKFKNPQEYIDEVNRQGGIGFVTHPFHKKKNLPFIPPHPWEDFYLYNGFQGIEIWSLMFDWIEKVNFFNLPFHILFPMKVLHGPSKKILNIWDKLSQKRKIAGISGIDAHGSKILPFPIFSYTFAFKTLRTHIWCKTLNEEEVYKSLREGHSFMALDRIKNSKGFKVFTDGGYIPGDKIKTSSEKLYIISPHKALFKIIKNGGIYKEFNGKEEEILLKEKGVYRIEGYISGKPWIFTNHIRISPESTG